MRILSPEIILLKNTLPQGDGMKNHYL